MSDVGPSGLGRRAAYAVLATGIEKAVALGIALYLPRRHLGLEDYGRYTFVLAYLNFFQVLPDAGHCDFYLVHVKVDRGTVSYVGRVNATAEGSVGADGSVSIRLSHGSTWLDARGRVGADAGSGVWESPSEKCSGRWRASRV